MKSASLTDSIKLANMGFYAYHGVTAEERKIGQRFFLDLEMQTDLCKAGKSDSPEDTLDYQKVYYLINEVTSQKKYKLLEALVQDIADAVLSRFPRILNILVTVRKPNVPFKGILDYVEVRISRQR